MSRAQRLTFLAIAVAIAVVAVVLLTSAGGDEEPAGTSARATATPSPDETAVPEATATDTPEATPTARPEPLVTPGKVTELRFEQGETVRFRVRADEADHVHVHGYDLIKDVEPGKTVSFSFRAEITGIFEVELEDAGEEIARLRVDPS